MLGLLRKESVVDKGDDKESTISARSPRIKGSPSKGAKSLGGNGKLANRSLNMFCDWTETSPSTS
jgi:hypothetical protein